MRNNPHVILTIARLFERDWKISKARKWYLRALTLHPDLGDAWAYYYAFELKNNNSSGGGGSGEGAAAGTGAGGTAPEEIVEKCVGAEPHHGELWTSISKRTEYRHDSTEVILKRVAEKLFASQNIHSSSS
jgi:pre-mRNA-processing factor 6